MMHVIKDLMSFDFCACGIYTNKMAIVMKKSYILCNIVEFPICFDELRLPCVHILLILLIQTPKEWEVVAFYGIVEFPIWGPCSGNSDPFRLSRGAQCLPPTGAPAAAPCSPTLPWPLHKCRSVTTKPSNRSDVSHKPHHKVIQQ